MKKTTYLAIAGALLLLLGGLYYFMKEEIAAVPPDSKQTAQRQEDNLSFLGNSMVEERDGKKIWEFTADAVEYNPNTKLASIENIKAIFYQDNGGKVELTAKLAVMNYDTRDILVEGDVKAVSSDGASLTAEKLRYAANNRHFYGDGGIKLVRDGTVITGDRIESDAQLEKVKVEGHALVQKKEDFQ